jgi:hypothetical protein
MVKKVGLCFLLKKSSILEDLRGDGLKVVKPMNSIRGCTRWLLPLSREILSKKGGHFGVRANELLNRSGRTAIISTRDVGRTFTTSKGISFKGLANVVYRHKHVEAPKPGEGFNCQSTRLMVEYQ